MSFREGVCGGVEGFGRCHTGPQIRGLSLQSSFTGVHTTVDLKGFDVVTMVRRLAKMEHSVALSQLASLCCLDDAGEDPFAK